MEGEENTVNTNSGNHGIARRRTLEIEFVKGIFKDKTKEISQGQIMKTFCEIKQFPYPCLNGAKNMALSWLRWGGSVNSLPGSPFWLYYPVGG